MSERRERELVTDDITAGPSAALADLLGVACPDLGNDALPLLWHWLYLTHWSPMASLGEEGHPIDGFPSPPEPGMRRMFAGGRVSAGTGLRVGRPAIRTTEIANRRVREGRSGALTFITTRTEITQDGSLALVEERDIVYRPETAATPPSGQVEAVPAAAQDRMVDINPMTLFRLSALTFNSHRIHYDLAYCRDVEGYPDLVIHGPLQALLMESQARAARPSDMLTEFSFRLVSPAYGAQTMTARAVAEGDDVTTAIIRADGVTTATGRAKF